MSSGGLNERWSIDGRSGSGRCEVNEASGARATRSLPIVQHDSGCAGPRAAEDSKRLAKRSRIGQHAGIG